LTRRSRRASGSRLVGHGTHPRVPAAAPDGTLEACARDLAPDGLAYVSYNTYPGWHLRGLVRDLMCYHVRRTSRPQGRVDQARALLDFLVRSASPAEFSNERLARVALEHLSEVWPQALPVRSLLEAARSHQVPAAFGPDVASPDRNAPELAVDLLRCFRSNLVELHTQMPRFVLGIGERPVASPLARFQAAAGTTVTNLRHEAGQLSEFGRHVLRHLDGRHDRAALREILVDLVGRGDVVIPQLRAGDGGSGPGDEERVREVLGPMLDDCLTRLARFALLIG
jgi:hypothetical protein